jgi:hypothetical protein
MMQWRLRGLFLNNFQSLELGQAIFGIYVLT